MADIPPELMKDGDLESITLSEACIHLPEESNGYSISSGSPDYTGLLDLD